MSRNSSVKNLKAKIIIAGEPGAGKSFIAQTTDACYPYKKIGVSIGKKIETFQDMSCEMTLMTWAITQGRPKKSTYIEDAAAAIIVCDLTRPDTVELTAQWANNILSHVGNIPLFFAANNADLGTPDILGRFEELAHRFNSPCFPIYSKDRKSASDLFRTIAQVLSVNLMGKMGKERDLAKDQVKRSE